MGSKTIRLTVTAGLAALLSIPAPAEAAAQDRISADRATLREYPGRLVLANVRKDDRAKLLGHCGSWVRVRLTAAHAMATPIGWVMRGHLAKASKPGGLAGVPDRCGTDGDRWRDWVGAINAPFHSVRKVTINGTTGWRRITFGTGVTLMPSPDCTPSFNYTRVADGPDRVDPRQRVELDLTKVSYRYVTTDGSVALISAPRPGQDYGIWSFVPATCVQPKGRDHVYFDEPVAQLRDISGLEVGRSYPDAVVRVRGCTAAISSPVHSAFGYWPDPLRGDRPPCPVQAGR
jgi:hypothetical protein